MIVVESKCKAESAPTEDERRRLISLLLFEAADCWMALPAWEVARLVPTAMELWKTDFPPAKAQIDLVDLDSYFGIPSRAGLWIEWRRGKEMRGLRIQRVFEVYACPLRQLAPIPGWLSSGGSPGPFWAAGLHGEEIFLVLDPKRLTPV